MPLRSQYDPFIGPDFSGLEGVFWGGTMDRGIVYTD